MKSKTFPLYRLLQPIEYLSCYCIFTGCQWQPATLLNVCGNENLELSISNLLVPEYWMLQTVFRTMV